MKLILFALLSAACFAQTPKSNGSTTGAAGSTMDNSAAAHAVIPTVATVGSLPTTGCKPLELYGVTGATAGQQIYENSGTGACVWTQQLNSGGGVLSGTLAAIPATCSPGGSIYQATDQAVGAQYFGCTSTNTWTLIDSAVGAGQGVVTSQNPTTGAITVQTDSTVVPRYFTGSGTPGINCTTGRDFFTSSTGPTLYSCTATNTWSAAGGSSSRTDVQNWYVGSRPNSTNPIGMEYDGTSVGPGTISLTGPNSISYGFQTEMFSATTATDNMMFAKKASHTWSAAAGTIDLNYVFWNFDTGNPTSTYTFKIYIGCSISNGAFSYGAASTVTLANPTSSTSGLVSATPALPASCAVDANLQFWIQRTDTQAGRIALEKLESVIRGN